MTEARDSLSMRSANIMTDRDDESGGWWALAQTPWGIVTIDSYPYQGRRMYHFRCCLDGRLHMWRSMVPQSKRGALLFARRMTQSLARMKR